MSIEPISPNDVAEAKSKTFPPEVIAAFNEIIAARFTAGSARVVQKEVVDLILSKLNAGPSADADSDPIGTRQSIYDRGWLNVEEIYRAKGWSVEYVKPGYNESYEAFFVFKKRR